MRSLGQPHNASSTHSFGRVAHKIIEETRDILASILSVPNSQIIFNSGATEGNNTVLKHFAATYPDEAILVGATEHPSVRTVTKNNLEIIPVDKDGLLDLNALEQRLAKGGVSLVSVMLINNETGVIQPIKEISDLTHKHGALLHSDTTQAFGKMPVSLLDMGIDFLSISSHKIGGAQGVGALALGFCGITPVLMEGGSQEKQARAGTYNVAGIASFGAAAKEAYANLESEHTRLHNLQTKLETALNEIDPRTIIFSQTAPRIHNVTLFALPGLSAETLMMSLDLEGIALSKGAACSSGVSKASAVLLAMNTPEGTALGALRLSMGWNTKKSDIDRFLRVWSKIHAKLKEKIVA